MRRINLLLAAAGLVSHCLFAAATFAGEVSTGVSTAAPASASTSSGPAGATTQPAAVRADMMIKASGLKLEPLRERIPGGRIDWTRGELVAVGVTPVQGEGGQANEMALRAARLVAAQNAAFMLAGIRRDHQGRFANVQSGNITVSAVVKDFREESASISPKTGRAIVRLRMPIGGLSGRVTVSEIAPSQSGTNAPPKVLIIDARGGGFVPCVSPRIATSSGKVLASAVPTAASGTARPAVTYASASSDLKLEHGGKGAAPLILKALPSPAKSPDTIVLSDEDAKTLADADASNTLLHERTIIIADEPVTKKH